MVLNRVFSLLNRDEIQALPASSVSPQRAYYAADSLAVVKQETWHASSVALFRKAESPQLGSNGGFLTANSGCFLGSPRALQGLAMKQVLKFLKDFSMSPMRHCGKLNTEHSMSLVQEFLEPNLQENVEGPSCEKEEIKLLIPEVKAVVILCLQSTSPSNIAIDEGDRRGAGFNKQNGFFSTLPNGCLSFYLLPPNVRFDILALDNRQQRFLSLRGSDGARNENDEASQPPNHDANEVRSINEAAIDLEAMRRALMHEVKQGPSTRAKASAAQPHGGADSCNTEPRQNEDEQSCLQAQTVRHLEEKTRTSSDTEGTSRLPQQCQVDVSGPPTILEPQSDPHPAVPCNLNVGNERTQVPSVADARTSRANVKKKRGGRNENPEDGIRGRARTSVLFSTPTRCTESSEPPFSSQPSCLLAAESQLPSESPLDKVAVIKGSLMAARGLIQELQYERPERPPEGVQVPVQELGQIQSCGNFHPRRGGVQATSNRRDRGRVRSDAPSDLLRQDTMLDVMGPRYLPPPQCFLWQVECQSELCPSAWITLQLGSTNPDQPRPPPPNGLQEVKGPMDVYERLGTQGWGSPRAACLVTSASPHCQVESFPFRAHNCSSLPDPPVVGTRSTQHSC